ncbi:MAG TPA: hypothetical protein PLL77_05010 [Pyrinomonadaceae bacterium]|nr:hypothetical protein [Pyrinomonadaceae bacterium]
MEKFGKWEKRLQVLLAVVFLSGIINFGLMFALSATYRGDAHNGYVKDGHYFLGDHGKYTEVSYKLYMLSWWQGTIVMASWIVPFLYAVIRNPLDWEWKGLPFGTKK